jgi:hypothetical protein
MQKHFFLVLFSFTLLRELSQEQGVGLGLILGEPTGISAKFWMNHKNALDEAFAWSFVHEGALYIHGDCIWHNFKLIHMNKGKLPFYYGIGGRLVAGNDALLEARIPLGLSYKISRWIPF